MNAIKYTGIVAAGALLASSAAFAAEPKWTYLEGAYLQGNEVATANDDNNDNDAYNLGGSFGFADKYHLQGYYIDGEIGNSDYDGYDIRFGVNPAVTDNTDFVTNFFYTDINFDSNDENSSAGDRDGYGARLGLRSMYSDKVELSAYGVYADLDVKGAGDSANREGARTWAEIGGQYYWTEAFSIGLDALIGGGLTGDEGETSLKFSARWSFF